MLLLFPQRYYYFTRHGIDINHVAAMEDSWLENVLRLVPNNLLRLSRTVQLLSDEMKDDYLLSVKKAIGILM